ncbi:hypothetical protein PYW08_012295 [Mythimna loreyi]|uniref:Uncharacterized protein n=1 Tax=Mythimna loreyi TaxID=667449 RepID=A0ACC2Q1N6_9NEOP|nr:hypothetical protein PYW08_012295 [Mythimna loreyi]
MGKLLIKFYCFLSILWQTWRSVRSYEPQSKHWNDLMGWHEKTRLKHLATDLFKESLLHMRQIIEIRNEHERLVSFNVGMIMGRIREKYRWMMETYRDILDQYQDRYIAKPPSTMELRSMHMVIALEMMHYFEIEIDKLVDVLLDEGTEDLIKNRPIIGQTEPRAWWKEENGTKPNRTEPGKKPDNRPKDLPPIVPGGPADVGDGPGPDAPPPSINPLTPPNPMRTRVTIQQEQKEKSRMREQFLMKKLGMSPNMTTMKKRFLHHWPVEETWSLDKYNQDYK